jgi:hypothetical protein
VPALDRSTTVCERLAGPDLQRIVMEVAKVPLTKTHLESMPERERIAVLLMGHAFNEINLLRKFQTGTRNPTKS